MATKSIAWNTGSGNITLTYQGQGDSTIVVQSDPNNLYEARSAQFTVRTTDGSNIEKTITIQQAAKLRVDISTAVVTAANQTYSGSAKTPTPTVTLNGETIPSTGYDVAYSDNTNAGTATITITGKNDYTGTATGTFTIAKANPTYTAPTARAGLTYSGSSQYLVNAGSTSHGTIQYSSNGTSWSTTRPSSTNAGSYTTYWRLVGDSNHNDVASTSLSTTIAKASRTLSFTDSYVVLDTSSNVTKTATPSAGSGDGTITYSISSTTYATINSSSGKVTSKTSDGSAVVTATIAEGTNYLSATASYNLYVFATTHNYDYNGSYRSVTLPPGTYQFQCWGAQGGSNTADSSYNITAKAGGKGGYSVGQLTVSQATGIRVYVGGQGSSSSGGYNGGGSSTGSTTYNAGSWLATTRMAGGGGATDIRLSDGSLYSRMIVAGGGSGGAMGCKAVTTTTTSWETVTNITSWTRITPYNGKYHFQYEVSPTYLTAGQTYRFNSSVGSNLAIYWTRVTAGSTDTTKWTSNSSPLEFTFKNTTDTSPNVVLRFDVVLTTSTYSGSASITHKVTTSTTTKETQDQVGYAGGGTSGLAYNDTHKATQSTAGLGGSFGQGANQNNTSKGTVGAAGGGGWYGGGTNADYGTLSYVQRSGGGSGFVNTAASAGNRPSGYTGLQLDSGTTYAGNTSFPSTSGSNETGHSGNGYARIIRIS